MFSVEVLMDGFLPSACMDQSNNLNYSLYMV